jgi:hypothetical protein
MGEFLYESSLVYLVSDGAAAYWYLCGWEDNL